MRNRFDSLERIHRILEPKLFLHAVEDEVVPIEHGRMLFEAAHEPKMFVETRGGHNTAHTADSSHFYESVARFLRQVQILN
jgi:dipeptidyl aminopeptidase/acylaminoacyl peptidase